MTLSRDIEDSLRITRAAIALAADTEGQDQTLAIELANFMLTDLITDGQLRDLSRYVKHYFDTIDGSDQAVQAVADLIIAEAGVLR